MANGFIFLISQFLLVRKKIGFPSIFIAEVLIIYNKMTYKYLAVNATDAVIFADTCEI